MKPRHGTFVAILLLASATVAQARVWTDMQGRQITAKFVRVHEESVILERGTKVVTVPLDQLCEKDRLYIEEQTRAANEGTPALTPLRKASEDDPPARRPETTKPTAEEPAGGDSSDPTQAELRTWTDIRGNKLSARFVKARGGDVVLLRDTTERHYPFFGFSPGDQDYIRKEMEARGEGHLVPASGPSPGAMAGMNGPMGPAPPNFPRVNEPPPFTMPTPSPNRFVPTPPPRHETSTHASAFPNRPDSPRQITGSSHEPTIPTPPEPSYVPTPSPPSIEPQSIYEKRCLSCNKVVPNSSKAGDRCPHCGVYWNYEEGIDGKRTTAYGAGRFAGYGFLVFLVLWGIGRLLRSGG